MKNMNKYLMMMVIMIGFVAFTLPASAGPVTFTDSWGSYADFMVIDGTKLQVTLGTTRNAQYNAEVLLGIFWNGPGLTAVSANVNLNNKFNQANYFIGLPALNAPQNIGQEWVYSASPDVPLPGGQNQGLSGVGLGAFGPSDLFPSGSDLNNKQAPDGGDFGLTGGTVLTSNGYKILIHSEAVFVLTGLSAGFDPSTGITNPYFQYGTDLAQVQVPEPATLILLGLGFLGLAGLRKKSKV